MVSHFFLSLFLSLSVFLSPALFISLSLCRSPTPSVYHLPSRLPGSYSSCLGTLKKQFKLLCVTQMCLSADVRLSVCVCPCVCPRKWIYRSVHKGHSCLFIFRLGNAFSTCWLPCVASISRRPRGESPLRANTHGLAPAWGKGFCVPAPLLMKSCSPAVSKPSS